MPDAFLNSTVAIAVLVDRVEQEARAASSTASSTGSLIRISVSPPASVSVTTSLTSVPMRADDEAPSAPTEIRAADPPAVSSPRASHRRCRGSRRR